ncbi:MAG: hypothetical protein GY834_06390 [Bacteroidetes bacterium]|nr:hypothetical protein [Bacteroidota bacterium]
MTDADQQVQPPIETKEVTGTGQSKRQRQIANNKVKKKKSVFSNGEVFFLLTRPLMGDPISHISISTYHISKSDGVTKPSVNSRGASACLPAEAGLCPWNTGIKN